MSGQGAFAAALLDPGMPAPPTLRTWNGSDPVRRFDVHRNNVVSSLVRALEDAFPVCCQLVGTEFFRAMAREYLRAEPPTSPVLLDYGPGFAGFVAGFAPAASVHYLADMARLERARVEAFHALDAEALPAHSFAAGLASPEGLMRARLRLHPSLRLLRGLRPVLALWQAHQPGHGAHLPVALDEAAGARRDDVLVLRPAMEVRAGNLPAGAGAMLDALARGSTLGEGLERAAAEPGFDLSAALAVLVHEGAAIALLHQD